MDCLCHSSPKIITIYCYFQEFRESQTRNPLLLLSECLESSLYLRFTHPLVASIIRKRQYVVEMY